ncbi:hypothetical protein SLEP1_g59266 [Rubroshorea leprosula]|uniref:Uncharacterized protein n=1 Tax=Rubroshorea leprosula TaxID=152421 RepID=A0AAV5MRW0_9ROSI|nr:hypothetical protein SLEP1_g59266 [Rubroshorea leprosula]
MEEVFQHRRKEKQGEEISYRRPALPTHCTEHVFQLSNCFFQISAIVSRLVY